MIRKLKLTYGLYNLTQYDALQHNVRLYEKLDLGKRYYSPVSSADFAGVNPADITRPDAGDVRQTAFFQSLGQEAQAATLAFEDRGYVQLDGFLEAEKVAAINAEIDRLVSSKELEWTYGNKLMFAIRKSPFLADLWRGDDWLAYLNCLIEGRAHLFQSINFLQGSQQRTHSDSIHMTTFPLGGLLGVWLALEDIDLENGPLHYYPESHKLPYFLNGAYDNEGNWLTIGKQNYGAYEDMIAAKLRETTYEKKVFRAKAGDLFIWHANLLHGGEPQLDMARTRKSMVLHYFDASRVCYHEITQRPALFK